MAENYYIGVDIGTGSVRAGLVSSKGKVLKVSVEPIKTWNPEVDYYEQSSDDIWNCCKKIIKDVAKDNFSQISGIGFDATCSLVVLDKVGEPLTVSKSGENERNIILWMDHRASAEAEFINETKHSVLDQVGGKVSLEMEIPKLIWLKRNLPQTFKNAGHFMDLADFLTYKATGKTTRSLCSLVCKWCYQSSPQKHGWPEDFFKLIDLDELRKDNYQRIGSKVLPPKQFCGLLEQKLATELGLPRIPVSTSMIDAHAGALGMLACTAEGLDRNVQTRLSLICGTSTCHMIVQDKAKFVNGVWGPYHNALLEDLFLSEAGQSATGILLDFIVQNHPHYAKIDKNVNVYDYLNNLLTKLADEQKLPNVNFLTKDVHVWPDFHGNRSPIADPQLKGMITGLNLANDANNLAIIYLATLQALCYGTQHIIEKLHEAHVGPVKSLLICGGISLNSIFLQTQADVCGLPVLDPSEPESVLVGAAILGAAAARQYAETHLEKNSKSSVNSGRHLFESMGCEANVIKPNPQMKEFHDKKYRVFLEMLKDQYKYNKIMDGDLTRKTSSCLY